MEKRALIVHYVYGQIGVNLEKYRTEFTKKWERDDEIIIEFREMSKTQFKNLELLAASSSSKIRMECVGVWGKMIALR